MQIAGQFSTSFLLDLHHPLFFLFQVMVEARVLDGDHCLVTDDVEDLTMFLREEILIRMGEEHHAISVQPCTQGYTISRPAHPHSNDPSQLRVLRYVARQVRLAIIDCPSDHTPSPLQLDAHVCWSETARRAHQQGSFLRLSL